MARIKKPPAADAPLPPEPQTVDAAVFEGRDCSVPDAIRWVAANIFVVGVSPETCPGPTAWNLLQWSRVHPDDFYSSLFPKLVPARAVLETEGERFGDDGTEGLTLVESMMPKAAHAG